jgi:hypothetical protein
MMIRAGCDISLQECITFIRLLNSKSGKTVSKKQLFGGLNFPGVPPELPKAMASHAVAMTNKSLVGSLALG